MEQQINLESIHNDLKFLKRAVSEMQSAMKDSDMFLSEDDEVSISEYLDDKTKDDLVSHDKLKEELGL